ncbi:Na/Pi cotransporter family protein [Pusillimonas sp. CC-YST705]|uniref:Na/Pi cotransporter family protein n=1 Tax=Mesopusillimonas faecipullorum TaxID=2755040 RepID=A0ABS8CDP9_9BURK|nr:Na/Pi symporter [Mesopusillimonas faecipullorum]MCB5364152.1 Na/Pi cotransporter family protein [Mesopusillimonas faecipullorum]
MQMAFQLLGGMGLFLIGMALLSDGLTQFAGDALRRALLRFTGSPVKAFTSGALITLVVQSSTATTVTLIGFVSAGLIGFAQALGVVMGASLGTTGTGWIVSTLGLKIDLGFYTMPLIGLGALARLLARGRWRHMGGALAGFGMLFVGIGTMQEGMMGANEWFSLSDMDGSSWGGRAVALLIGLLMTVLLQSSTATVAATLTALDTGAVDFELAAVVVIGAAIGTTMTGVLAALGGSLLAKRTALAHVVFNFTSGLIAMLLLPLLLAVLDFAQHHLGLEPGGVSLAAFHTLFIGLGVALFLPHADWFARRIERLLPERGDSPTRQLDSSQWQVPALALAASGQSLQAIARGQLHMLSQVFEYTPGEAPLAKHIAPSELSAMETSLRTVQEYFTHIPASGDDNELAAQRLRQMHVLDHLLRLQARAAVLPGLDAAASTAELAQARALFTDMLKQASAMVADDGAAPLLQEADALEEPAEQIAQLRQLTRRRVMQETAQGEREPGEALHTLDTMLWLQRSAHHVWRVCHYLAQAPTADADETP